MKRLRPHVRARLGLLAILSVACAYAFMGQDTTDSQSAHLALIRAFANGTAVIDETRADLGNIVTHDVDFFEGHYYAAKAPGLAFTTLPLFVVLKGAGMRTNGDPARMLWALGLLGSVLPATLLLLLMRWIAERVAPGFGAAVAVVLGLGTLLLPFASLFFAHALSALLVFAAFVILWHERQSLSRLLLIGVAGLAAGYAITTEYQNAIAVSVLGVYAVSRGDWFRRGLVYAAGVLVGITPMLVYNGVTFGWPLQFMHGYAASTQGPDLPNFRAMLILLFWSWGLLAAAPVLASGALGTVFLFRRGQRAEALVIAAICIFYLAFNSGVLQITGGLAGTRYLIVILPFLVLPLGLALQSLPLTTVVLSAGSIAAMVVMTATRPAIAGDGHVLQRLTLSDGSSQTLADFIGVTGWYDILPFYLAIAAALLFVALATPLSISRAETWTAVAAVAGWGLIVFAVPGLLTADYLDPNAAAVAFVALVAVVVAVVAYAAMRRGRGAERVALARSH